MKKMEHSKETVDKVIDLYWKKATYDYIKSNLGISKKQIDNILNENRIGAKFNNKRSARYYKEDFHILKTGKIFYKYDPTKELKAHLDKDGYLKTWIDGVGKFVHRVIAEEHIPNPENKPCVNHKDGNKINNHVDNLEWVTYSENELHSHRTLGKQPYVFSKEDRLKGKQYFAKPLKDKNTGICYDSINDYCRINNITQKKFKTLNRRNKIEFLEKNNIERRR